MSLRPIGYKATYVSATGIMCFCPSPHKGWSSSSPYIHLYIMALPPGPVYLIQNAPRLAIPPLTVYALSYLVPFPLAMWMLGLAMLLSFPLALALRVYYANWQDARNAAMNDAIIAPRIPDPTPGSVRTLKMMVNTFKNGYPGS